MSACVVNLRTFRRRSGPFTIYDLPADVVRVDRRSTWGNPFRVAPGRPSYRAGLRAGTTRAEAIQSFRTYATDRLIAEPTWLDPLEGKRLACHCWPLACHADVLVELRGLVWAARRVMRTPEIGRWLAAPAAVFDGLAPRDVIGAGRTRDVVAALQALAEGTFV